MSKILDFYTQSGRDSEGRMLADVWNFKLGELEYVHDYIQWLFPLTEPSMFNADAPLLTTEDIEAFRKSDHLKDDLFNSFMKMLYFYGIQYEHGAEGWVMSNGSNWVEQKKNWLTPMNHNLWRITRILKCLTLLGLEEHARNFFDFLIMLSENESAITKHTMKHWKEAVGVSNGHEKKA